MMKSKKTALLTAGLTVLLSAAVIVGGTFAIFGTSKTREVTITTGSVDISAEFGDVTLYSLTPSSTEAQPTGSLSFNAGGTASLDSAASKIATKSVFTSPTDSLNAAKSVFALSAFVLTSFTASTRFVLASVASEATVPIAVAFASDFD